MLNLYAMPNSLRVAMILLGCALAALQAACALYSAYTRSLGGDRAEILAEWLLLAQTAMLAFLPAAVQTALESGLILFSIYDPFRYVFGLTACAAGLCCGARVGRWDLTVSGALAAMTLPAWDGAGLLSWAYALSILYGLGRVFFCLRRSRRKHKTTITCASIRAAMDRLPGGMMFYDNDGVIRLNNARMRDLERELLGTNMRDGALLWQRLCEAGGGESPTLRMEDGGIWRFTRTRIRAGKRAYWQVRAADVTDITKKREELERRQAEIVRRSERLRQMLHDVEEIRRAEEIGRAQRRIHDVLGLRVSILQRTLREKKQLNPRELESLMSGRMEEMRGETKESAALVWRDICDGFAPIGVAIHKDGGFPEDAQTAYLFVEVAREAVVNAVRHANATNVYAFFQNKPGAHCLRVENDGVLPGQIAEGGGLTGIRRHVEAMGGTMRIDTAPRFALAIEMPERSSL